MSETLATPKAPRGRVLVVDDEPLKRITLQIELTDAGYEVADAADAVSAMRIFDSRPIDVVVTDVRMSGPSGLDLLAHVKKSRPEVVVILMTAYATVDTAVLAMKRGAYDYITKPFTTQELIARLEQVAEAAGPPAGEVEMLGRLVARSAAMKRCFAQVRAVADSERTILLCGESGTGKELVAEAIHNLSRRVEKPFIRLSCAALTPGALESELFGHEAGAIAGVTRAKAGRFELANGGTMLLDEVDDMPLDVQVRLLRAVETQEFQRVGGEAPLRVDVRLICATKHDLLRLVREGRFREDLYYRLNVINLTVPPLRTRSDDIAVLVQHFIEKHAALVENRRVSVSPHTLDELLRHAWPGNVRELEHVIERALAFCAGDEIRPEHVLPRLSGETPPIDAPPAETMLSGAAGLTETIADIEKRMILMALKQSDGNQARAAQRLGIPRTTLRDKMARYSIPVT